MTEMTSAATACPEGTRAKAETMITTSVTLILGAMMKTTKRQRRTRTEVTNGTYSSLQFKIQATTETTSDSGQAMTETYGKRHINNSHKDST